MIWRENKRLMVLNVIFFNLALLKTASSLNPVLLKSLETNLLDFKDMQSTTPLYHKGSVKDHHSNFALASTNENLEPISNRQTGQKKYVPMLTSQTESTYTGQPTPGANLNGDYEEEDQIKERLQPYEYNAWQYFKRKIFGNSKDNRPVKDNPITEEFSSGTQSKPTNGSGEKIVQNPSSNSDTEDETSNKGIKYAVNNEYNNDLPLHDSTKNGKSTSRRYSPKEVKPSNDFEIVFDSIKPFLTSGTDDRFRDYAGSIVKDNTINDNKLKRKMKMIEYMQPKKNTGEEIIYLYIKKPKNKRTIEKRVFGRRPKYLFNTAQLVDQEYPKNSEIFANNPYLSFSDDPSPSPMSSGQPVDSGNPVKA